MLSNCPRSRSRLVAVCLLLLAALAGCTVEQHFGGASPNSPGVTSSAAGAGSVIGVGGPATTGRTWQWLNPSQGGAALRAVWATSSDDVWYVGEQGTVIHWDGVSASKPYASHGDETFYTVWASGPKDVWVAGDRGPGTGNVVVHWDGTTWSSDFSLAAQRIHSIWGIDATHVFAMTSPWPRGSARGEIWWWNGHNWALWGVSGGPVPIGGGKYSGGGCYGTCIAPAEGVADGQHPPLLRDAWGIDRDHIWVVGDAGTLTLLSVDNPDVLTRSKAAVGSPVDPFDPNIDYLGVWGSAVDNVWAIFADHVTPSRRALGLAHWDGQGWWAWSGLGSVGSVLDETGSPAAVPDEPRRTGHLLSGVGPDTIVQIAGHLSSHLPSPYDSKFFNGAPFSSPSSDFAGRPDVFGLGGDGKGHLYAAGDAGAALQCQNPNLDNPWTGTWDKSPALNFYSIAPVGENEAFAVGDPIRLAHWTGMAWSEVQIEPLPNEGQAFFSAIAASSASDVWAVGYAVAAHFDGTSWMSMPITFPPGDKPGLQSVWAASPNDAWAVGQIVNYYTHRMIAVHWDGAVWNKMIDQNLSSNYSSSSMSVFGVSPNEVWITAYLEHSDQLIWRWDGHSLMPMTGVPNTAAAGLIWGTSGSDLWVTPPADAGLWTTPTHFDGTSWTQVATNADLPISAISGTASNDVWMIATRGSESGLRSFDGQTFSTPFSSPVPLRALSRGPDGQLWAVGQTGATLRLPAPSTLSPR